MSSFRLMLLLAFITWSSGLASAMTIVASTAPLPAPSGTLTPVDVSSAPLGSAAPLFGDGYTVSFSGMPTTQGVVRGLLVNQHAPPVNDAGPITGNYLSTGLGAIEISFSAEQYALFVSWGSIDPSNQMAFFFQHALVRTVTGAEVALAAGIAANGSQGPGGTANVVVTDLAFDTVVATSGQISFEFHRLVAAATPADDFTAVPSSGALGIFGLGLLVFGVVARRRHA